MLLLKKTVFFYDFAIQNYYSKFWLSKLISTYLLLLSQRIRFCAFPRPSESPGVLKCFLMKLYLWVQTLDRKIQTYLQFIQSKIYRSVSIHVLRPLTDIQSAATHSLRSDICTHTHTLHWPVYMNYHLTNDKICRSFELCFFFYNQKKHDVYHVKTNLNVYINIWLFLLFFCLSKI